MQVSGQALPGREFWWQIDTQSLQTTKIILSHRIEGHACMPHHLRKESPYRTCQARPNYLRWVDDLIVALSGIAVVPMCQSNPNPDKHKGFNCHACPTLSTAQQQYQLALLTGEISHGPWRDDIWTGCPLTCLEHHWQLWSTESSTALIANHLIKITNFIHPIFHCFLTLGLQTYSILELWFLVQGRSEFL